MPALSKKQQKFMGIVRSIQKGEQPASKFSKDAQDVAKDMKKKDVKKFASTKHKGLPMKKEILGKLKEMIKQELSEYTYGVGDVVKDVNPTCPHFGAQGKVKSVNPRSVVFVVTNKGDNFKPGQELEKSHDQMKKIGESINVDIGSGNVSAVQKGDDRRKKIATSGGDSEIVKEMSAKTKKIINKLGKKEKEMFMDMVDMMGFDQVMADYKRDKKAFKQALKDMSESVITEKFSVKSSRDYFNNLEQAIGLIIRQANNLKGPLAKHPIKRNVNKLKAVQTMLKKGVAPAFYAREDEYKTTMSFKAVDITLLKKKLQDGKFKSAVEYSLIPAIDTRSYDSNDFYFLKDKKEDKLRKRLLDVLFDLRNKMDKAQLENINEDTYIGYYKNKKVKINAKSDKEAHKQIAKKLNVPKKDYNIASVQNLTKKTKTIGDKLYVDSVNENRDFEKLYKLFSKKDYFGLKGQMKTQLGNYKRALKKGDKGAQKYSEKDVIDSVTRMVKNRAKFTYDELEKAIKKKDIRALKSKLRHDQPYSIAIFNQITGKKLPKTTRDIRSFLDNEFMNESVNEDGHTDVASSKRKVMIMVDDSNKLLNKLNGMNKEDSLPSWWSDKITLSQNYLQKATNYLLNPVESVNENLRQSDKKVLMVIGRDFVQWINSKFKHGLGKKEIRGLKQTLPNMLSILGRPEDKRYNKFKSSMNHSPIRKYNDKLLARLSKGFDEMSDYNKKVFVNTLMYNAGLSKVESVNESKEPEVITQLRDIVKRKTNKKIKDPKTKKTMRVDMFTASAITQVYDAVKKTSHKSKFESLPLDKMAQLSFKMMK